MLDVQAIIDEVERLLASGELSDRVALAIRKLLNVVEELSANNKSLADEVERLRKKLDRKKYDETTDNIRTVAGQDGKASDHDCEERRNGIDFKPR